MVFVGPPLSLSLDLGVVAASNFRSSRFTRARFASRVHEPTGSQRAALSQSSSPVEMLYLTLTGPVIPASMESCPEVGVELAKMFPSTLSSPVELENLRLSPDDTAVLSRNVL